MNLFKTILLILLVGFSTLKSQLPVGSILHLKADAGIVPNGNKVSEWNDISNSGIKAFMSDSSFQPTFVSNAINGKPAVRFNGTQYLEASSVFPVQSDYSLFFVVNVSSFNYFNCMVSGNGHGVFYNPPRVFHTNTSVQAISNQSLSLNKPAIMSVIYTESTQTATLFIDGVKTAEAVVGSNFDPVIYLGAYYKAYFLSGDIPEVIIYPYTLSNEEQKNVETYLFDKYFLEHPSDGSYDNTFSEIPANNQLFPRDTNNFAIVKISGNIKQNKFNKINLRVFKDNSSVETLTQNLTFINGSAKFNFNYQILAELSQYNFIISAANSTQDSVMKVMYNIVAGDVILINGQSNSIANNNPNTNQFIRTYGGNFSNSPADTLWEIADDWSKTWSTNIGAWGITLGQLILENQRVPVCVINGGVGGTPIESHLPDAVNKYNLSTIYGSMLYRVEKSGLKNAAKAMFWYQGESNSVYNYQMNFISLTDAWLRDFPNLRKIYTVQIHQGCGASGTHTQLREVQRIMPKIISKVEIETIASAGLPGHDGCHYDFIGYQTLGEQLYRLYNRDFFGSTDTVAISSPNISEAFFTNQNKSQIALVFKPKLSKMVLQQDTVVSGISASLKDYLYLDDDTSIMSLSSNEDTVFVNLVGRSSATRISYSPEIYYKNSYIIYEGPWIYNQRNMGALAFFNFPVTVTKSIIINNYTKELVACIGSTDNFLICDADISDGLRAHYQWYKDDIEIQGETKPILYFPIFNYKTSSNYKCKVFGEGFAEVSWTGVIPVYAVSGTEITKQPVNFVQTLGNIATFSFGAHINGKNLFDAIVNDEVTVQWYRYESDTKSIALNDEMSHISGSKSNYLTISNLQNEDFGKYWAEITGLCGAVKTDIVELNEGITDLIIEEQTLDEFKCEGSNVNLFVNAYTHSGKKIKYQWYKGNTLLKNINGVIEGTNTNHLIIYNIRINDEDDYFVELILDSTSIVKQSHKIKLSVLSIPIILTQPKSVNINSGEMLFLEVLIANTKDTTLNYQWYHDGNLIEGAIGSIYQIAQATTDDAGEYRCEIANNCGLTKSEIANVVITKTTSDFTDVSTGGFSLSTPVPNPISEFSIVKYYVPENTNVKISISDLQGTYQNIIADRFHNSGEYSINMDINRLNICSGIYFIKLESKGIIIVQKIVIKK